MAVNVVGNLVTPLNVPAAGVRIRVEATNTDETLFSMVGEAKTDANGDYDFQLVEGKFNIEVNFSDEYKVVKEVTVDGTTPSPVTLTTLLA